MKNGSKNLKIVQQQTRCLLDSQTTSLIILFLTACILCHRPAILNTILFQLSPWLRSWQIWLSSKFWVSEQIVLVPLSYKQEEEMIFLLPKVNIKVCFINIHSVFRLKSIETQASAA